MIIPKSECEKIKIIRRISPFIQLKSNHTHINDVYKNLKNKDDLCSMYEIWTN